MKKRVLLIFSVVLFSAGLIMVSRGFQRTQNEDINKKASKNSTEISKESGTPHDNAISGEQKQVENAQMTQKPEEKKENNTVKTIEEKPNFIIEDNIHGEQLLALKIEFSGKTVQEVTMQVLRDKKITHKATGSGDTFYISMMNNIRERDEGPQSGWCYFIDGRKYSIGAGTYKLGGTEILVWKFLKDGVTP